MRLIDYLHRIESVLQNFKPTLLTDIQLTAYTSYTGTIRGRITFPDGSILYFREYLNLRLPIPKKTYSYHYQKGDTFIFRYDSAPHHRQVSTFPHHKHVGDSIISASIPELEEVFCEIKNRLVNYV